MGIFKKSLNYAILLKKLHLKLFMKIALLFLNQFIYVILIAIKYFNFKFNYKKILIQFLLSETLLMDTGEREDFFFVFFGFLDLDFALHNGHIGALR